MSHTAPANSGAPAAAPVANDAWYLHGQGRRFGPLTEDDMRGYFRAGMVKGNDAIAVPGQVGTVPAAEAAAILGVPAPAPVAPSAIATAAATSIRVTETGTRTSGVLIGLGLFVAIGGFAYFKLHVPASAAEPAEQVAATPASSTATSRLAAPEPEWEPNSAVSLLGSPESPPAAAEAMASPGADPAAAVAANPAMQAATTDGPSAPAINWANDARALWGNWSALLAHAQKWTMAEPREAWAWWYLGVAQSNLGDKASAMAAYQQGLAVDPSHFKLRWALANAYSAQSRHRESTQLLQALIREQPNESMLWNDLGYDWAKLGEYDETAAALEKAVQLDPRNRRAWSNLVWAYGKFGYLDKAQDARQRAAASL